MQVFVPIIHTAEIQAPPLVLASGAPSFSWTKHLLVILLIGIPVSVGAYLGFPVFDDAYYSLLLKEQGPGVMLAAHPDRPLFGLALQWFGQGLGSSVLPLVAINFFLWTAFALEAAWLWRLVYPGYREYSLLVSCLVFAPIVVQTQPETIMVFLVNVVPALLSYGGFLLILLRREKSTQASAIFLGLGCALTALSVLISEYGLASAMICAVIATGYTSPASSKLSRFGRSIPIILLLSSAAVGYAIFLLTTDPTLRSNVTPQYAASRLGAIISTGFNVVRGITYSVFGSYGTTLARVQPNWGSKWTVACFLYGLAVCLILRYMIASNHPGPSRAADAIRLHRLTLPAAILAGLGPVALMGRDTAVPGFASRFLLPVLPICVMATVFLALQLTRPRRRHLVVALLGFLAGFAAIDVAVQTAKDQQLADSIGAALLPRVHRAVGLVVAVADTGYSNEPTFTGKVTWKWTGDLSRRFWVVGPLEAQRLFGTSTQCSDHPTIERDLRKMRRSGPVGELLAVYVGAKSEIRIEPYCWNQQPSSAQPATSAATDSPAPILVGSPTR